jgi:transcriptional regulator with XRE-family HTH domain
VKEHAMKANPFKRRREQLGLTQQQIADAFTPRLRGATISMWERGVNAPRRCLIDDLARIYRQPTEWAESSRAAVRKLRDAGKGAR